MTTKPSQRAAADRWDAANMAYQSIKVRKDLLDKFKAACAERGDKVNTVLREAMEQYVTNAMFTVFDYQVMRALLTYMSECISEDRILERNFDERTTNKRALELIEPLLTKFGLQHIPPIETPPEAPEGPK